MPTDRRKPSSVQLSQIIEGLLKAEIEFVLVGGLAAVVQGAPVTTMDVDIVHHQASENLSRLARYLQSVDAIYRRPDEKVIEPTLEDISGMGHLLLTTRLGPLDVLAYIEGNQTYDDLLDDSDEIEFRGKILRVLSLRKLVELKKKSKTPEDKQRLVVLEKTLRQRDKQ